MATKTVLFTSLKGGCGTSTVCANVAAALAKKRNRVLLLSFNRYCSSVDMMLGMESSFVFDISDFPERELGDICVRSSEIDTLWLALRSPFSEPSHGLPEAEFLKILQHDNSFDFIIVDKTEGSPEEIAKISELSESTVIVTTQMNDSVRCAELMVSLLSNNTGDLAKFKLLINSFHTDARSLVFFTGIDGILNAVGIGIIGIIPFSDKLYASQTNAYASGDAGLCAAFENISMRLLGEDPKLLDFLPTKIRRRLLNG